VFWGLRSISTEKVSKLRRHVPRLGIRLGPAPQPSLLSTRFGLDFLSPRPSATRFRHLCTALGRYPPAIKKVLI